MTTCSEPDCGFEIPNGLEDLHEIKHRMEPASTGGRRDATMTLRRVTRTL